MKKTVVLIVVTLSLIFGFTLYALVKNPPEEQQAHEHDNEQTEAETTFLEQTFADIDPSVSKTLVLKVEEMDNREPADAIVNSIVQYEGSIGKVSADLNKKVFAIEYDTSKLKEDELLQTVKASGYTIQLVTEETPTP